MTLSADADVLIVGAGPAGLTLALCLLQNGISVRIIDKLNGPQVGQRGPALQPRLLELFNLIGVLPDFLALAGPLQDVTFYKMGSDVPMETWSSVGKELPTPDIPYPSLVLLGQDKTEAILRRHLKERFNKCVEFSTTLEFFEQHERGISVNLVQTQSGSDLREKSTVAWLIGADGSKSTVRKQGDGFTFPGETHDSHRFIVGDVHILAGLSRECAHRWGDLTHCGIALRPSEANDTMFQFLVAGSTVDLDELLSDHGALLDFIAKGTGKKDLVYGDLVIVDDWKPKTRMANKFSEGRVFIVGDAAHIHITSGGQGIISGVQDSMNLGWKLALVQRGLAPQTLLASYAEERLPVIKEMLLVTRSLFNQIVAQKITGVLGGADIRQFGVNYRWSSIVLHGPDHENALRVGAYGAGRDGVVRAGDRAPEAPGLVDLETGGTTSIFGILNSCSHTVLLFTDSFDKVAGVVDTLRAYPSGTFQYAVITQLKTVSGLDGPTLQDCHGYASKSYSYKGGVRIVVIRPDGFVGAISEGAEGLLKYIKLVFAV